MRVSIYPLSFSHPHIHHAHHPLPLMHTHPTSQTKKLRLHNASLTSNPLPAPSGSATVVNGVDVSGTGNSGGTAEEFDPQIASLINQLWQDLGRSEGYGP